MTQKAYVPLPWEIAQIDTKRVYQSEYLVEATAAIRIGPAAHKLIFAGQTTEAAFLAIINLIAAAPELLEALELFQEAWLGGDGHALTMELMEKASAKAAIAITKAGVT